MIDGTFMKWCSRGPGTGLNKCERASLSHLLSPVCSLHIPIQSRLLRGMLFKLQETKKTICTWNRSYVFRQRRISYSVEWNQSYSMSEDLIERAGLLLLTGMLWGCTNPFIRQGTRGLRKVKADTWFGQACAEITFLLSNWKYVLPWLVNQAGSLVYLLAVQRVPLSLAVPAANSLAFAFTALTGAAVGSEQPLDSGAILGIVFIGVGTALCCWDRAD